jgi:UDP-N-acetylmuramate dehydrogenase
METQEGISLKPYNTLAIDVNAAKFIELESERDVKEVIGSGLLENNNYFILGRGSNTLFTDDVDGVVLYMNIEGKEIIDEDNKRVVIEVGAGEDWPEFVEWAVDKGWSGLENMAYIPGTMGAAPVQNIAAYGQVFEDIFVSLDAYNLNTGEKKTFKPEECDFDYRRSVFKNPDNDFLITKVRIELSKDPKFDTNYHSRYAYESLTKWLEDTAERPYTPKDVANAVTQLRKYKLPEWDGEFGTCGSFFVNPFVTIEKFKELSEKIDELQHYPVTKMEYDRIDWHDTGKDDVVKIPAGRILDELGWRGKWIGNVGTFDRHALLVITNRKASGEEVKDYTDKMKEDVKDNYGVELKSEVIIK